MYKYVLNLVIFFFFISCSNDSEGENPGTGLESFSVIAYGSEIQCTINEEEAIISIPDVKKGEDITDVKYTLSDKSTIYPDPKSLIYSWDREEAFIVTKSNGESKRYTAVLVNYEETVDEDVDAKIYVANPYGRVTKNFFYDIKDGSSVTEDKAVKFYQQEGMNGIRIPIYGNYKDQETKQVILGHTGPGEVVEADYAKVVSSVKKAKEYNPDLMVFASKKLNGKASFADWLKDGNVLNSERYAGMIIDFLKYMKQNDIEVDVLGIDNEYVHNPSDVYLHPSLPDTELMRYTYATFYDRIHDSDDELGKLISMLKEEGVLDNTIIFYFGDNGGSLPGTKGYTDDIGIHVPLVVYVPEKWRDRLGIKKGSVADEPVSFMDFAPTVLKLAGVDVPEQMDGQPFIGEKKKDDFIVGYGDRFDELYAFNRTLRKGKYRYARNYQPYHSQSLFALYRYKQLSFRECKDMFTDGKLNGQQSSFFMPFGPEELYDLEKDPYEMNNLAKDERYKKVLLNLRNELNEYLVGKADLGFFPETVVLEEGMTNPATWGERNRDRIKKFAEIAQLQTVDYSGNVENKLRIALQSDDAVERMWALTTCSYFAGKASALKGLAEKLLDDERSFVRCRAMVFLSELGDRFSKNEVLEVLDNVKTGAETMFVLNDLTHMFENNLIKPFNIKKEELKKKCTGVDWRVKYLNSCASSDSWSERWKLIYKENNKH